MIRWGSCAADGALSFSWRIVMAPPKVIDYLALALIPPLGSYDNIQWHNLLRSFREVDGRNVR